MKLFTSLFACAICVSSLGQISPSQSTYNTPGSYTVVADSNETISPNALWYRPQTPGNYPVFFFQPGANGFFSSAIDRHSYDLYLEHIASYGYVVVVVDETAAGLPNGNGFTAVYDWFITEHDNGGWPLNYCDLSSIAVGGHSNGGVNATNVILDATNDVDAIVYLASYPSNNFLLPHDVSNFSGYVLSLSGSEDTDSSPSDCKTGFDAFTNANCGVYVEFDGMDHGGFGDYNNTDQPVGSMGRVDATSSVKHYLVSFLEYALKGNTTSEFDLLDVNSRLDNEMDYTTNCLINNSEVDDIIDNYEFLNSEYVVQFSNSGAFNSYSVYDLNGRSVKKVSQESELLEINKNEFQSGVYLIQVNWKGNLISEKIIIP